ncbi:MAG: hypothetical protein LBK82_06275 [Planctomycetaceae bacterium]|nr:hypothetical protein [Planctomycetaceae bacterium]
MTPKRKATPFTIVNPVHSRLTPMPQKVGSICFSNFVDKDTVYKIWGSM